jgi:subtilisin-like proprotein convertase family protein
VTAPSSTPGTTIGQNPSGAPGCVNDSPDVYYNFTPTVSGTYTIDLCGSTYDTRLSVYTDCPATQVIGCNDDFCGLQSGLTLDLTAGTTYYIRVHAFGAATTGDFILNISAPPVATGGCCVDGECTVQTEADCATAGGTYLGDGTDCDAGGGGGTVSISNPNLAIPDNNPVGVQDTLTGAGGTITSMLVTLNLTHTWQGDVIVTLTHNATNTTVTLVDRPGNPATAFGFSADNYGATGTPFVLSDSAATTYDVPAVVAPGINNVSGAWLPDLGPLSAFNGLDANSTWTLTVSDNAGGDTGTLVTWSIIVNPESSNPCEPEFCDADWCQDGEVGVPDIFCFLSDWFAMDPAARCYGGTCDVPAIFAFLSIWFATGQGPCP